MAASTSVIAAKDGTGTTVAGGLVAQDKSGAGTGPFYAAHAVIDSQGVNVGTVKAASTAAGATDTALVVAISPNNTVPVSLASLPSGAVTNAGTFAVQATLQATATTAIGKVDPNTVATWGLAATTQNVAAPTNGAVVMGQFTTTPTTLTTTNVSPLQMDNAGNLLVNIKAGAGSGGTAIADEATFTEGTTSFTPVGGVFKTSQTALTTGQGGAVALSAAREMMTLSKNWDGTNTAAVKAASTAPSATDPALVVAISPNSVNANGSAVSASSAPVVIASDQAAVATKHASGSVASGSFAAGSIASGAIASGAIASGAAVSGAFVAGAIADLAHGQGTMSASVPVTIASNQSAISTLPGASATGGASNLHFFSVTGTPTATAIKASAGTLYGVQALNTSAAVYYLKIYNTASGSVTVGTTVPLMTIPVPTVATTGAGIAIAFPVGIAFGTAISWALTAVAADNDATAAAVGVTINVQFA